MFCSARIITFQLLFESIKCRELSDGKRRKEGYVFFAEKKAIPFAKITAITYRPK